MKWRSRPLQFGSKGEVENRLGKQPILHRLLDNNCVPKLQERLIGEFLAVEDTLCVNNVVWITVGKREWFQLAFHVCWFAMHVQVYNSVPLFAQSSE